jgi:hypothetical protein
MVSSSPGAFDANAGLSGFAAGKFLQQGTSGQLFFFCGPDAGFFAGCIGHSSVCSEAAGVTGVVAAVNAQCAVVIFHDNAKTAVNIARQIRT